MKKLFMRLVLASFISLASQGSYALMAMCGIGYVAQEGGDTFYHAVSWTPWDSWWGQAFIEIGTELYSPVYGYGYVSMYLNGDAGGYMFYLPNPPDGIYEGGGYSWILGGSSNSTSCGGIWELDTIPEPAVSLMLSPNPVVIGDPVTAIWTVANAVSCAGYGPGLPSQGLSLSSSGGSTQIISAATMESSGTYTVICAATDGDTGGAAVNLNVWECDDGDQGFNYFSDSQIPTPQDIYLFSDLSWRGETLINRGDQEASCQSYCTADHKRRYRIIGGVTLISGHQKISTYIKESASCETVLRENNWISNTVQHEGIHASEWVGEINNTNNLIKLNPQFTSFPQCMAAALQIRSQVLDSHNTVDQRQAVHAGQSGMPYSISLCVDGYTVEALGGYYP